MNSCDTIAQEPGRSHYQEVGHNSNYSTSTNSTSSTITINGTSNGSKQASPRARTPDLAMATEYQQCFTWKKPMVEVHHHQDDEPSSLSEYQRAFGWRPPSAEPKPPGRASRVDIHKSRIYPTEARPTTLKTEPSDQTDQKLVQMRKKKSTTEYHAKFRPFSDYFYVAGNGFKMSDQLDRAESSNDRARQWFSEVQERSNQARKYRSRSQLGHPVVGADNLQEIYSQTGLWDQPTTGHELAALSLATQQTIAEKKQERSVRALISPQRPTAPRFISSAPSSLRQGEANVRPIRDHRQHHPVQHRPTTTPATPTTGQQPIQRPARRTRDRSAPAKIRASTAPTKRQVRTPTTETPPRPEGKIWIQAKKRDAPSTVSQDKVKPKPAGLSNGHPIKSQQAERPVSVQRRPKPTTDRSFDDSLEQPKSAESLSPDSLEVDFIKKKTDVNQKLADAAPKEHSKTVAGGPSIVAGDGDKVWIKPMAQLIEQPVKVGGLNDFKIDDEKQDNKNGTLDDGFAKINGGDAKITSVEEMTTKKVDDVKDDDKLNIKEGKQLNDDEREEIEKEKEIKSGDGMIEIKEEDNQMKNVVAVESEIKAEEEKSARSESTDQKLLSFETNTREEIDNLNEETPLFLVGDDKNKTDVGLNDDELERKSAGRPANGDDNQMIIMGGDVVNTETVFEPSTKDLPMNSGAEMICMPTEDSLGRQQLVADTCQQEEDKIIDAESVPVEFSKAIVAEEKKVIYDDESDNDSSSSSSSSDSSFDNHSDDQLVIKQAQDVKTFDVADDFSSASSMKPVESENVDQSKIEEDYQTQSQMIVDEEAKSNFENLGDLMMKKVDDACEMKQEIDSIDSNLVKESLEQQQVETSWNEEAFASLATKSAEEVPILVAREAVDFFRGSTENLDQETNSVASGVPIAADFATDEIDDHVVAVPVAEDFKEIEENQDLIKKQTAVEPIKFFVYDALIGDHLSTQDLNGKVDQHLEEAKFDLGQLGDNEVQLDVAVSRDLNLDIASQDEAVSQVIESKNEELVKEENKVEESKTADEDMQMLQKDFEVDEVDEAEFIRQELSLTKDQIEDDKKPEFVTETIGELESKSDLKEVAISPEDVSVISDEKPSAEVQFDESKTSDTIFAEQIDDVKPLVEDNNNNEVSQMEKQTVQEIDQVTVKPEDFFVNTSTTVEPEVEQQDQKLMTIEEKIDEAAEVMEKPFDSIVKISEELSKSSEKLDDDISQEEIIKQDDPSLKYLVESSQEVDFSPYTTDDNLLTVTEVLKTDSSDGVETIEHSMKVTEPAMSATGDEQRLKFDVKMTVKDLYPEEFGGDSQEDDFSESSSDDSGDEKILKTGDKKEETENLRSVLEEQPDILGLHKSNSKEDESSAPKLEPLKEDVAEVESPDYSKKMEDTKKEAKNMDSEHLRLFHRFDDHEPKDSGFSELHLHGHGDVGRFSPKEQMEVIHQQDEEQSEIDVLSKVGASCQLPEAGTSSVECYHLSDEDENLPSMVPVVIESPAVHEKPFVVESEDKKLGFDLGLPETLSDKNLEPELVVSQEIEDFTEPETAKKLDGAKFEDLKFGSKSGMDTFFTLKDDVIHMVKMSPTEERSPTFGEAKTEVKGFFEPEAEMLKNNQTASEVVGDGFCGVKNVNEKIFVKNENENENEKDDGKTIEELLKVTTDFGAKVSQELPVESSTGSFSVETEKKLTSEETSTQQTINEEPKTFGIIEPTSELQSDFTVTEPTTSQLMPATSHQPVAPPPTINLVKPSISSEDGSTENDSTDSDDSQDDDQVIITNDSLNRHNDIEPRVQIKPAVGRGDDFDTRFNQLSI